MPVVARPGTPDSSRLPLLAPLCLLVTVVTLALLQLVGPPAGSADARDGSGSGTSGGTTRVVAPGGSGSACSVAAPCSLATAVAGAGSGAVVELAAGRYPAVELKDRPATRSFAANVVVRPAAGAQVVLGALDLRQARVSVQDLTIEGQVYVYPTATGARLQRVHVSGSGVFVRSSDVEVTDSLIEGGHSIDGLQIKDADHVLVQGTTIRDFDQSGTSGMHSDCVQIFDARDITLRGNRMADCYNSAIIFSGGADTGISRVLIESNFIQGCAVKGPRCNGGNGLELRYERATDVTVRNNTFENAGVRMKALPGLVFDRNIVSWLSQCETPVTNSIIQTWNVGLCKTPDALLGSYGNRVATPDYVDAAGGDLRIRPDRGATVTVDPVSAPTAATTDIDGRPLAPTTAGASQPQG